MPDDPAPNDPPHHSRGGDGNGTEVESGTETGPGDVAGTATGEGTEAGTGTRAGDGAGRSVVVPDRVYKAVTVFSTLFAVVTVVGGFIVLDGATNRARAPLSEVDPLVALAGIGLIVLGAVTYAFSTRFHAEGMGNAKDAADEPSNDG